MRDTYIRRDVWVESVLLFMVVGWLCVALLSAVLVEILQYIMKKITIFLISFNSHYISFHSSVFFLFEMCRWISKKQINYSLALPVSLTSHSHLVNKFGFAFFALRLAFFCFLLFTLKQIYYSDIEFESVMLCKQRLYFCMNEKEPHDIKYFLSFFFGVCEKNCIRFDALNF